MGKIKKSCTLLVSTAYTTSVSAIKNQRNHHRNFHSLARYSPLVRPKMLRNWPVISTGVKRTSTRCQQIIDFTPCLRTTSLLRLKCTDFAFSHSTSTLSTSRNGRGALELKATNPKLRIFDLS